MRINIFYWPALAWLIVMFYDAIVNVTPLAIIVYGYVIYEFAQWRSGSVTLFFILFFMWMFIL